MPFRWTIKEQLVHVVAEGPLDLTAAVEALFAVARSADFTEDASILVDLTAMDYEPGPAEAAEIARVLAGARSLLRGKVAVVAVGESFELADMAASMASESGITIRAFRQVEAARAWLLPLSPAR